MRMPTAIALLLATALGTLSGQELLRVSELAEGGEVLEQVLSALLRDADRVAAGNDRADVIATAGSGIFTSPLTTGRVDDLGIVHHWHDDFQRRLDALDTATRDGVIAALDRLVTHDTGPAEAMRLTPAPKAVGILSAAADRAFDRGQLRGYLAIASELDRVAPGWERAPGRRDVARRLLALAPTPADAVALGEPGPLVAASAPPIAIDLDAGATVSWVVEDDHLLACDPWLQVRWQRPLEPRSRVHHGAGAAAIRTERSLLVLDEDGRGIERPIAPTVRLLGIRDGAAWLAVDDHHHAIRPDGSRQGPVVLAEEAIDAPLVQDERSLWLTATTLEYLVGDEVVLRSHHGLPPGPWRLRMTRDGAAISGDNGTWLIGSPRRDRHPRARWADHLVRAGRSDVVLSEPAGSEPATLALAQLRAGAVDADLPAPADAGLALQLAIAAHGGLPAAAAAPAVQALARAADDGTPVIPGPDDDPRDHPAHWRHAISPRALLAPATPLGRMVADGATDAADDDGLRSIRDPELGPVIAVDGLRLRVRQADRWIVAEVHDAAGLRWRQRFAAAGFFLPTVGIALAGDAVLVAEGQSRVRIYDRRFGLSRGQVRKPVAQPLRELVPLGDGSACYRTRDGQLMRIDGERRRPWPTPLPVRWVVPVAGGAVAALDDGRAIALPSSEDVAWPADLLDGDRPTVTRAGLRRGGTLWRWLP